MVKLLFSALRSRPAAVSGVLLLAATVAAIVWANSGAKDAYHGLWATMFTVGSGAFVISKPLLLWVNDALMAVFFLLVGLEIKREVLEGALSSVRKATLPMAAALGGVLLPAGIYLLINQAPGGDRAGWAIPAATDIAFALGVLALLGSRVPLGLKVFLTAVAVVDDLAAIAIIGVFFTSALSWPALLVAGAALAALIMINMLGARGSVLYVLLGLILWVAVLKSGLHATLAGVLLALTIPARRSLSAEQFADALRRLVMPGEHELADGLAPDSMVHRVRVACNRLESPLVRWEHALQPVVFFLIVPVFALANAGVSLAGDNTGGGPVALGVALGLLLGKPLGLTLFAWLAVRLRMAELPPALGWRQLHAVTWLAGIGFTMSLFIGRLALHGASLDAAKIGLLAASGVAACVGAIMVWRACPANPAD